jgi:hypothetical protein
MQENALILDERSEQKYGGTKNALATAGLNGMHFL